MVRLGRGDHRIHHPALERVYGRGPGAVDLAKLLVARVYVQNAPVLEAEADPAAGDRRHLRGLAVDEPEAPPTS